MKESNELVNLIVDEYGEYYKKYGIPPEYVIINRDKALLLQASLRIALGESFGSNRFMGMTVIQTYRDVVCVY